MISETLEYEAPRAIELDVLKLGQPIGDIYLASMPHELITSITLFDVRRVLETERDVERYLGIQRPLEPPRVKKLEEYVNFFDATFPTAIIIAIDEKYAVFDESRRTLRISNVAVHETKPSVFFRNIAKVLDGQHRIAGLMKFKGPTFDVPVSIFVGADEAEQAQIFSTVNLEQTKVHKNLVYDLYALARSRSPQKTCHNVAVALDQDETSALFHRIKRLGGPSTRHGVPQISQAQFVENLMRYISAEPRKDRDVLLRGEKLPLLPLDELLKNRMPLRNQFIKGDDYLITEQVYDFFKLVARRWPEAWTDATREGGVLNRTNGFRALMRLFGHLFQVQRPPSDRLRPSTIASFLAEIPLRDEDITTLNFPPGSSGEGRLYRNFVGEETLFASG
jgi:DGQHR domain-containing protein